MRIAKLVISYDRGLERNDETDLKGNETSTVSSKGTQTADGKIIRGLGTHFKSQRDQELVKTRDQIASKIRQAFRERFVATSIDGCYVLNSAGEGKSFIDDLGAELNEQLNTFNVGVRVQEFDLVTEGLDTGEIRAWSDRIRNQLAAVQLGRKKEIDDEGLNALVTLSNCPLLSDSTGNRIRELVAAVRENKITRIEVRRSLAEMDVEIDQGPIMAPRRPSMSAAL